MREYFYLEDSGAIIKIRAPRKPSLKTRTQRGTWCVLEWTGKEWSIGYFPEILWGTLSKLTFIGSVLAKPIEEKKGQKNSIFLDKELFMAKVRERNAR